MTSNQKKQDTLNRQEEASTRLDGVFRKSSFSDTAGCVSIAKFADGSVKIQDTKDTERSITLTYTKKEWLAFLKGVRSNEFEIE